jgi:hypothetical protein
LTRFGEAERQKRLAERAKKEIVTSEFEEAA